MTEQVQTEQEPSPSRGHNLEETMMDLEPKRSSSPSVSQISARTDHSMDHPAHFKGEPLRSSSPSVSQISVRTDHSMDHPANFKGEPLSGKSDRSSLPCPSQDSEESKGQIENSNREPDLSKSELAIRLLTDDEFKCSICNEVFNNPVNTPCGHSFCSVCINSYWQQPDQEGLYKCPQSQCSKEYSTCPELYISGALVQLLKWARYSPVLPAPSCVKPGEVACDICRMRKLRAVKFCLTCNVKYCEVHIKDHYTVPALQKHQCVEATKEPPTSSSNPEPILTDKADALQSNNFDRSPLAGSICPEMMTPPTGTSGKSQCGSFDSDPNRSVQRGHDESPPYPSMHMKTTVRKLQFTNDQEDTVAERSSKPSMLQEMLMKMKCDIIPANT
ncbi:uncharacterized protein LOC134089091 [Sardina pilchardus]|uniref:uncharacterized protein LOC134089091 n=1 Tax=Sardina pilchardus TaxID=27697 RepID=UPI002E0F0D08